VGKEKGVESHLRGKNYGETFEKSRKRGIRIGGEGGAGGGNENTTEPGPWQMPKKCGPKKKRNEGETESKKENVFRGKKKFSTGSESAPRGRGKKKGKKGRPGKPEGPRSLLGSLRDKQNIPVGKKKNRAKNLRPGGYIPVEPAKGTPA